MRDPKPTHPHCPICDLSMWLTQVELGDIADKQQYEYMVRDRNETYRAA